MIKINDNRLKVLEFERTIKVEQELYNEGLNILKGTKISIDDKDALNKLLTHYVSALNITVENPLKLLPLTENSNNYYRVKEILGSLTFDFEVYTESGKEKYVNGLSTYLSDPEEIKVFKRLKKLSDGMLAEDIDKGIIKESLKRWNWGWNPYNTDEIQLNLYNFREGIKATESIKAQKKRTAERQVA